MVEDEPFFIYELLAVPPRLLPAVFMHTFSRFEKSLHSVLATVDPEHLYWKPTASTELNWRLLVSARPIESHWADLFQAGWAARTEILAGTVKRTPREWKELISHWEHLVQFVMWHRPSIEVLAELQNRYAELLLPTLVSVRIVQLGENVWLEIVEARPDQWRRVEREDLRFIFRDHEPMFTARLGVEENARRFLHDLDTHTICTALRLITERAKA